MSMNKAISVSDKAKQYLQAALKGQEALGVRLGVRKRGCAGYEYVVDFAKEIKESDQCFDVEGVSLVVDSVQLETFLAGTHIDYEEQGLNAELKFLNPRAESHCGCGESFNLREEERNS